MLFSALMDTCLDPALVPEVEDLLRIKMETPEIGTGPRRDVINSYLDSSIEEIGELIQNLPDDQKDNWSELNRMFLHVLGMDN